MADNLPLAFQTEYNARVLAAYQANAMLRDTTFAQYGVVGKYCQFRRRGKGMATPHVRNAPVTPLGLDTTVTTVELTDWDAVERSDPFDLAKINWNDHGVIAESLGMALGRRHDQILIDTMIAGATAANTIAVDYESAGTTTTLTVEKINHARALLLANGVPARPGRWHMAVSALAMEGALNDTKIGSQDYNVIRALFEGTLEEYCGFRFHVIADNDEGGLPTNGSGYRQCLAWDMDAIGYAEGISEGMNGNMVRIDWDPSYQGWVLAGKYSAGAGVVESAGLVEILVDESKSPTNS